jgi:hypothetical protein
LTILEKPVTLVTVTKDKDIGPGTVPSTSPIPTTHLLLAQGDNVFLHILRQSQFSLVDLPTNVYSQSTSQQYRVKVSVYCYYSNVLKDFSLLVYANMVRMPKSLKEGTNNQPFVTIKNGIQVPRKLEMFSRFFPVVESETVSLRYLLKLTPVILFGTEGAQDLKNLLEPIKERIFEENLSTQEVETCLAVRTV